MNELVVLVTAPPSEAGPIAETLVKEKLVACVNIIPSVRSIYWWKGNVEDGVESLLVIKTLKVKLKTLTQRIQAIHSYTVPEILALPVDAGSAAYLKWMRTSLQSGPVKQSKRRQ